MDCLVQLAALCLFDPSNVYLAAAYEHQLTSDNRRLVGDWRFDAATDDYAGTWRVERFHGLNYGRVELGWHMPVGPQFEFSFAVVHRSLLVEGEDRGQESALLGFTWRPFR